MEEKELISSSSKYICRRICFRSFFVCSIFFCGSLLVGDFDEIATIIIAFPSALIGVLFLLFSSSQIVVTDKRVYGITLFRTRVDLPLDSISAVGCSYIKRVTVSTSSGKISFPLLDNHLAVYKTLNELLIERQKTKTQPVTVISSSYTDEIQKLKILLDDGIITQEEFEAKKKQLLGL